MSLYGPLNELRRAARNPCNESLRTAVIDYLSAIETGHYDINEKQTFTHAEDMVVKLGPGYIPLEIICDELGMSMPDLDCRMRIKGLNTPDHGYDESHVKAIMEMADLGFSEFRICKELNMKHPNVRKNPPVAPRFEKVKSKQVTDQVPILSDEEK